MNSIQYNIWISSVNKFHVSRVTDLETFWWCLPSWHPLAHKHSLTCTRTHTGAYSQVKEFAKVAVAVAPAMQKGTELKESKGMLRPNTPKREKLSSTDQGQVLLFHTCIILQLLLCAVHVYQSKDENKESSMTYDWIYVYHVLDKKKNNKINDLSGMLKCWKVGL